MFIRATFIRIRADECVSRKRKTMRQIGKLWENDFLPREGQMIHNHGDSNFTNRTLETLLQLGLATLLKHFNHKSFLAYLPSIAISLNRRSDTTCSMATRHFHRYLFIFSKLILYSSFIIVYTVFISGNWIIIIRSY